MSKQPIKISQLQAIVPAVRPAWLHLVQRYEFETGEREWYDDVLPVLAYASVLISPFNLSNAFLVAEPSATVWVVNVNTRNSFAYLVFDNKPARGNAPVSGVCNGWSYSSDEMEDGGGFEYIYA